MIQIFIDGSGASSKRPELCPFPAAAMMVFKDNKCVFYNRVNLRHLQGEQGNSAEWMAFKLAEQYVFQNHLSINDFCIYSDSRFVIKKGRYKNYWTYKQLCKSSEKEDFRFRCTHLLARNSVIWEGTCKSRGYFQEV